MPIRFRSRIEVGWEEDTEHGPDPIDRFVFSFGAHFPKILGVDFPIGGAGRGVKRESGGVAEREAQRGSEGGSGGDPSGARGGELSVREARRGLGR